MKKPESDEELYALFPPEQREAVRWKRERAAAAELQGHARSELLPPPPRGGRAAGSLDELLRRNSSRALVVARCCRDGARAAVAFRTSVGVAVVTAHDDYAPNVRRTFLQFEPPLVVFDDPKLLRRAMSAPLEHDGRRIQPPRPPSWKPRLDVLAGPARPQAGAWPLVCRKCHKDASLTREEMTAASDEAAASSRRVLKV